MFPLCMALPSSTEPSSTRVALPARHAALIVAVLAALGAGLALALPPVCREVASWPWAPLQGPLRLLGQATATVAGWVLLVAGVVVGAVAGAAVAGQTSVITVSYREVLVTEGSRRVRVARAQVAEAEVSRGHLVLRDRDDVELAYEKVDGDVEQLRAALERHGWTRPVPGGR